MVFFLEPLENAGFGYIRSSDGTAADTAHLKLGGLRGRESGFAVVPGRIKRDQVFGNHIKKISKKTTFEIEENIMNKCDILKK